MTKLEERTFVGRRVWGVWRNGVDDSDGVDSLPAWTRVAANLYLGGHPIEGLPPDVDVIVNVDDVRYYEPPAGAIYVAFPFEDAERLPDMKRLAVLADSINAWGARNLTVYVHCRLGVNRSALLVALALVRAGVEPETVLRRLRAQRDPHVLCNETFERAVLAAEATP